MKLLTLTLFIVISILLVGCKTYNIPVDSFKQQFEGVDSSKLQPQTAILPLTIGDYYKRSL